ncbi:MAG TPA: hypothetical protein VG943_09290, partial [Caulobacterales bacterium]|nr:hypothetical protein [Caulobacterales bacterium]
KPNTPPPTPKISAPRAMRRRDHARTFKLDATFRIVVEPRLKRARRTRRALRQTPQSEYVSVGGVAGRFEALVRAFNDPAAHAKRLARRLHADPKRVFVFLRWLKPIGHARGEDWDAAEDGAQALSVAHFANTS